MFENPCQLIQMLKWISLGLSAIHISPDVLDTLYHIAIQVTIMINITDQNVTSHMDNNPALWPHPYYRMAIQERFYELHLITYTGI